MSKFERYKKKAGPYIYPHKHCKKCDEMVTEAFTDADTRYPQAKARGPNAWYRSNKTITIDHATTWPVSNSSDVYIVLHEYDIVAQNVYTSSIIRKEGDINFDLPTK